MGAISGRGGGGAIPVEAARACVAVGTADIRILIRTCAVIQALPALGGEDGIGGTTRGGTFETVGVGQGVQQVALGVEGGRDGVTAVGGRAEGADDDAVVAVGGETGEGHRCVGCGVVTHDAGTVHEGHTVGGSVAAGPSHGGGVHTDCRCLGRERCMAGSRVTGDEGHHHAVLGVAFAAAKAAVGGIGIVAVAIPVEGLVARA